MKLFWNKGLTKKIENLEFESKFYKLLCKSKFVAIMELQEENAKLKQRIKNQYQAKISDEINSDIRKLKSLLKNQKVEPIIKYPFNFGAELKEAETISDIVKMWESKQKTPVSAMIYNNGLIDIWFNNGEIERVTKQEYQSRNYNL